MIVFIEWFAIMSISTAVRFIRNIGLIPSIRTTRVIRISHELTTGL